MDDDEHLQVTAQMEKLFRAMHAVVRKIPRGRVLTYGQLAELSGLPGGARVAGAAMKRSDGLPWQRVVGKAGPRRGRIAIHDPVGASMQRQMLAAEGVPVSDAGTIDLGRYGWLDPEPPRRGSQQGAPAAKRPRPAGAASRRSRPTHKAAKESAAKATPPSERRAKAPTKKSPSAVTSTRRRGSR